MVLACGPAGHDGRSASEEALPTRSRDLGFFVDVSHQAGLDFVHANGRSGALYLAEITCGGGGLVDIDNDGDLDIYLSQGRMLGAGRTVADALDPPRHPLPLSDRLYRNDLEVDSDGRRTVRLVDVTEASGIAESTRGYGCGVAAGDLDNDGDNDLLVLALGPNQLLLGHGDGTFDNATAAAGLDPVDGRSSVGAALADFDRDGWLDAYVVNNLTFVYDPSPPCFDLVGAPDYCGPGAFAAEADTLWHNRSISDGGLRFADATANAGLAKAIGPGLGVVAADVDGDGWTDLYVANDGQPNFLWHNLGATLGGATGGGGPTFAERALLAGAAVNGNGAAEASMGVDVADYDRDGDFDLVLAHLFKETHTLYRNDGRGRFDDRTRMAGLAASSLPATGFGAAFLDLQNDGWLDLVVANGAVTHRPELVRLGDPFPLHQPNQLFLNQGLSAGETRFEDATERAGDGFHGSRVSRGVIIGDIDNDGDADVLVVNNGGPARLLLNQAGQDRAWLGLRLVGGPGPGRDMLGAVATLSGPDGRPQTARAHTDGSYNASHDPRVLFGLGEGGDGPYDIHVTWPEGRRERYDAVPSGRYTTLRQGEGTPEPSR